MSKLFSLKNTICTRQYSIKCLNLKSLHRKHLLPSLTKDFSNQPSLGIKEKPTKRIIPFQEAVETRRNEANCSIIVQVQSAQSYKELHTYCSGIGTVKNMLHYTTGTEPLHFIIVEFGKEVDIKNIFSTCSYIEDMQVVPVHSPFLWFKASTKKLAKLKPAKNIKLNVENGTKLLTNEEIIQALANSEGVSGQMINLHKLTKLNDIGTRLRFLAAKQIEMAICGMFPGASAIPFGSSVNGYGKMGCDLDLVLRLKSSKELTEEARLVYHCKASMGSERSISQRHMESIGDLIQLFLPGCSQVRRILQARVPIIKYYQQLADVECDLSMTNMSGFYMSDLLYIMGSIDWRVRPLIFTIRRWAAAVGITNSSPGRWISNFSLTLLVIAFLQSNATSSQILPSMNTLINMAGTDDKYITEDGINCTFLRDINKYLLVNPVENEEDLKCLLLKFFEYYSNFDFTSKAISLNDAVPITKPEHSALYIVNPLQRGLNVSKNVSSEELDKFRMELRNAAWLLESENEKSSNWGVLNLLLPKKKLNSNDSRYSSGKGKLIEVSKLFDEDDENDDHVFKNGEVKKQVEGIKKETKQQLKKIEGNHLNLNRQNSGR